MKKCPNCDKTFEDSMRFCQVDGTPLLDDAPAFDPYATIVAQAIPVIPVAEAEPVEPAADTPLDPAINYTVSSIPIAEPDDILDLPTNDPLKTMYVSDAEMQATFGKEEPEPEIIDIPPIEISQPEPPSFIASEPALPVSVSPPPSPFAVESIPERFSQPAFLEPEPAAPVFEEPEPAPFDEAATMIQPNFISPFDHAPAPAPVEPWTPPPAPEANWQNQEIGSNTPFQPPPAGASGANKTLPIVSLVLGILSLCCYVSPITGLAAIITGFMGMKNANNDPSNYGGKGLAIAGMATGGIFFLIGVIYYIFVLFFGGMAMIRDATR